MNSEFSLESLIPKLEKCYVLLKPRFTKNLLASASKTKKLHKDKNLLAHLSSEYNSDLSVSVAIAGWYKGKRSIPISVLEKIIPLSKYSWTDIEKNLISLKPYNRKGAPIRFPLRLDGYLGCVVGHILGDGSIEKKYNQVFYTNSNKDLLAEFSDAMFHVFGMGPRIWIQQPGDFKGRKSKWIKRVDTVDNIPDEFQGALFYPKICGILLHALCGEFAKGKRKKITKDVLQSNSEFKKFLIRAFFDDEGSISLHGREIRVFQDNENLLHSLRSLLCDIGIHSSPIHFYLRGGKRRQYMGITGHYSHLKFFRLIGFTCREKGRKLSQLINGVQKRKTFRLRRDEAKEVVQSFLREKRELSIKEISSLLKTNYPDFLWDKSTILEHLGRLEKEERVQRRVPHHHTHLWSLKKSH